MEPRNNQILDMLLKNRPLLITLLVVFVLIPVVLLIIAFRSQADKFKLESVLPEGGASVSAADANIEFSLSKDVLLVQKDTFEITVEPEVEFVYGVLDNKLRINLSKLKLIDNQTYNVTVSNLVSRSGEVIRNLNTNFVVDLEPDTAEFIQNLPYTGDGFTIENVSNNTLYISVTKQPESKYEQGVVDLLISKGIIPTKFNLDISLPSDRVDKYDDGFIRH